MGFQNWTSTGKSVGMTAIFAAAALLGGCASKERLRLADLLREQNLVGGGMTIEWKAPEAGTVYLVEKKTRKLVETRSLDEGEAFSFTVDSVVRAQELGDILGINVAKAEFLLYFEPASRGKLGEQVGLTKP